MGRTQRANLAALALTRTGEVCPPGGMASCAHSSFGSAPIETCDMSRVVCQQSLFPLAGRISFGCFARSPVSHFLPSFN